MKTRLIHINGFYALISAMSVILEQNDNSFKNIFIYFTDGIAKEQIIKIFNAINESSNNELICFDTLSPKNINTKIIEFNHSYQLEEVFLSYPLNIKFNKSINISMVYEGWGLIIQTLLHHHSNSNTINAFYSIQNFNSNAKHIPYTTKSINHSIFKNLIVKASGVMPPVELQDNAIIFISSFIPKHYNEEYATAYINEEIDICIQMATIFNSRVYFKAHPRLDTETYNEFAKKLENTEISMLNYNFMIEGLFNKKIQFILGNLSTALLSASVLYNIPCFTYSSKYKDYYTVNIKILDNMLSYYYPNIFDFIDNNLTKDITVYCNFHKEFISKEVNQIIYNPLHALHIKGKYSKFFMGTLDYKIKIIKTKILRFLYLFKSRSERKALRTKLKDSLNII